jgi:hypothetical protein
MSGGSMDYVYSRIEMAAEEVQEEIRRIEEDRDRQGLKRFKALDYYREKYPDNQMFRNEAFLKHAVLKRLREAVSCMKKAAIYARRVEWLTSCDDGYESFVLRVDEELKELENSKKECSE